MSKWHFITVLLLLVVLGVILWIAPPKDLLNIAGDPETKDQLRPDAFMVNSKTTQYDVSGSISHILTSDKSEYFEANTLISENYARLTNPRIVSFTQDNINSPWKASSDNAITKNNEEDLYMTDNVILSQVNSDESFTRLTSDALLMKPNSQYAETDKPVMIETASGVTTALGLTISLETNTIKLLSNVRSRYETNN